MGEFLGFLIVVMYGFTLANYVLKWINKKFGKTLRKAPKLYKWYIVLMKFVIKNHRFFGIAAVLLILTHFYIQFTSRGLSITGVIAASLMILQATLGAFGFFTKPKSKTWLYVHRTLSVLILIAILLHI